MSDNEKKYILTIEEARDALRVDGHDNDSIIYGLMEAIPEYIETCSGCLVTLGAPDERPIIKTVAKFILQLWYNPDGTDSDRLNKVIESLFKTMKALSPDYRQDK